MNRLFIATLLLLVGCGGGGSSSQPPSPPPSVPQVAGAWEMVATSANPPQGDAALQTRIETGLSQQDTSITGSPNWLISIEFVNSANDFSSMSYVVGGFCGNGSTPSLTATVNSNNQLTFTLDEGGGAVFTGTGTLQSNGTITGTYSGGGSVCPDSGSFVAKRAVSLTGNYANNRVGDPSLTMSLSEGTMTTSASLTANAFDNTDGQFTLAGNAIGDAGQASGTEGGQPVQYYGLFVPNANWGSTQNIPLLFVIDQNDNLVGALQKQ
jgi:hypothetical protein